MRRSFLANKAVIPGALIAALFLSSCAAAPVTEGSSLSPAESTAFSQPPLSNLEEEHSLSESADGVTASPEVTLPEERETEPELVATFQTGADGVFDIGFIDLGISIPPVHRVDENGTLYAFNAGVVTRIPDGKQAAGQHSGRSYGNDLLVKDGLLYVLYMDGFIDAFSMDDESVQRAYDLSATVDFDKLEPDENVKYTQLQLSADGEVLAVTVSKAGRLCYRLDGTQLTADEAEQALPAVQQEENGALTLQGASLPDSVAFLAGGDTLGLKGLRNGKVCLYSFAFDSGDNEAYSWQEKTVYIVYDRTADTLSREIILRQGGTESIPCEIVNENTGTTLTEYVPQTVFVGETRFDNVADSALVYGADGEVYLVLYYEKTAEVYRLHLGFTSK